MGSNVVGSCPLLTSIVWNAKKANDFNYSFLSYDNQIETFTFGDNVEYIPDNLCEQMSKLTSVTIPDKVTTIGKNAFGRCSGLTSVTIGNSVKEIRQGAFYGCNRLTAITIPNSVTDISYEAFAECRNLANVTIGNSVENIRDYAFGWCEKLTTVIIPNSVKTIGSSAFEYCTGLTSITIGSSTETIYKQAFHNCPALKTISCLAINPPVCWWGSPFDNYDKDLFVPTGSGDKYRSAEVWKEFDITEKTFSGIHSAETKEARIYTRSHNIVIENALPGTPLSVYNTAGVCIESMEISDSETEIALPAQGLYIVKYGDRSMKVVL